MDSLLTSSIYVAFIDRMLAHLCRQQEGARISVIALGGYGRCEMGPHSDVDLLVLHEDGGEACAESCARGLLYPLWDAGMNASVVTRTIADCRHLVREDARTLTALLDARLVMGDERIAASLQKFLQGWFALKRNRWHFVRQKRREHLERRRKFGDSVYLLQPNVKEGEGGLRDFHTLVWLTRATYPDGPLEEMLVQAGLTERGVDELAQSVRFVWRIRHELHLRAGKCQDRLGEDIQDEIAAGLGFTEEPFSSAAEQLMQSYYRHASVIRRCSQWALERMDREWSPRIKRLVWSNLTWPVEKGVVRRIGNKLSIARDVIERDPLLMLRACAYAAQKGLSFDAATKGVLEAHAQRIGDTQINAPQAHALWRAIFARFEHAGTTIREMHECGCLQQWIPEIKPLIHRILHDGFHIYTVDVHTIHAIAELSSLAARQGKREHPLAAEALRTVSRPHVVLLATLLHDIGKGRGGDHEELGATIASDVVRRMGFSDEDIDDVAFLIRSHMLMPKLAFQRDMGDESLIARFAQTVRTPQMLAMLYVLTFADMRSVGPHLWSTWKEGLLGELYRRTREHLVTGQQTEARLQRLYARRMRSVQRILGKDTPLSAIESFLATMPKRYAWTLPAPAIATHVAMMGELGSDRRVLCDVRNDHERGISELSIVTPDSTGLFAKIAGVLTAHGLNINDADLYTTKGGVAVDVIRLTDLKHQPVDDSVRWRRIIKDLKDLDDERRMSQLTGRLGRKSLGRKRRQQEVRVEIDNDVSATDTVVEIHADDRPGILYRIAHIIASQGCSIERARIATHVDRVTDVFYIRDSEGRKLSSPENVSMLRDALRDALEERGNRS